MVHAAGMKGEAKGLEGSAVSNALRQGFRPRDPRIKVLLPSRMRVGASWVEACIHNVSSRGLLVASDEAPKPGTYVEIRRGRNVLIGRAVWARGRMFGVRTQDRVDLAALKADPAAAGRRGDAADGPIERRGEDRFRRDAAMARTLERNRALSHLMQFGLIAFGAVAACALVATAAYSVLQAPLARIQQAMAPDGGTAD